jgi:hypothetical protein
MIQKHTRSSVTLLTTSLLAGLIGLTTIGCTSSPTATVPQPTPSKSSASIDAPRSTIPVTKGEVAPAEPSVVNPTVPATTVASTIRDGRYWVGGTDQGLEIQGDRYRYDTEGGEQPWRSSTELQPIKDGVIFDGKAHWCLSTMAPKSGATACSESGWVTGDKPQANLPFVGTKRFNFLNGSGTGQSITIEPDGTTTVKTHGTMDTSISYSGPFTNPIIFEGGDGVKLSGDTIYSLRQDGEIAKGCIRADEPCKSELN